MKIINLEPTYPITTFFLNYRDLGKKPSTSSKKEKKVWNGGNDLVQSGIARTYRSIRERSGNVSLTVVISGKKIVDDRKKKKKKKKFGMEETVNLESQPVGVIGRPMEDREVPRCNRNAFAASPVHRQSQCHKC